MKINLLKKWNIFLLFTVLLNIIGWYLALFWVGADKDQGNVYRIIYIHVPVAWCAFFWVFFGAVSALLYLIYKSKKFDQNSHAAIKLGTLFSCLVLVTGSIWGKPTWGVWWDWDPRLTSSLVMSFICFAYLLLRKFTPHVGARRTVAAILALLNALYTPIVYFSVNLWRSLHQPQTFVRSTQNASQDIAFVLLFNVTALFLLSIAIHHFTKQSIQAQEDLEEHRASDV